MRNTKTVASLLRIAADLVHSSTEKLTGQHMNCPSAISLAATKNGFRKEVVQRAIREFRAMHGNDFGIPKTGRTPAQDPVFGKMFSETRDKFAVKNVLKNRDNRVAALEQTAEKCDAHFSSWPSRVM